MALHVKLPNTNAEEVMEALEELYSKRNLHEVLLGYNMLFIPRTNDWTTISTLWILHLSLERNKPFFPNTHGAL